MTVCKSSANLKIAKNIATKVQKNINDITGKTRFSADCPRNPMTPFSIIFWR